MVSERVLRVPRIDAKDGAHTLVHVSGDTLSLAFEGTEGETPYVSKIKEAQIATLRAKNYHGSEEEWRAALEQELLQRDPSSEHHEALTGLQLVSSVADGKLTLLLRKNIDGITQRLGAITLDQDDDQEIQLFDWCALACTAAGKLREDKVQTRDQISHYQKQVQDLQTQLDDLVKAKQEHEDALFSKFQLLLNTKKLKIRDQQRLLAGAQVDPTAASTIQTARQQSAPRSARQSAKGKRKADAAVNEDVAMQDDEDAAVKKEDDDDDDIMERKTETDRSEADTTDSEGFDEVVQPSTSAAKGKQPIRSNEYQDKKPQDPPVEEESIPAPRALPFGKKAPPVQEINEDEETDDEL